MKCLSEMHKQMAAFILRQRGSRVTVQLGTWWMSLTGREPSGQPEGGVDERWKRRSGGQVRQIK